jgi:molecular chaperone Hsp33
MTTETATLDTALGFTIASRHARGRVVRLGPALDTILAAHAYPPALSKMLAEALVLAALLGSTLKHEEGQLTLQAQTKGGAIDLLVADYRGGEMRGYLRFDADRIAEMPAEPSLFALFGKGYLAITFDQAPLPGQNTGERYQGIVPLEGGSLADAAEHYFAQSEQLPSLVRVAVRTLGDGTHVAGGILVQHLPEGEEGRERLHTKLDHPEWQHEEDEVRILPVASLSRGCRCSPDHIQSVIARFPPEERAQMADENGLVHVDCEFCAKSFPVALPA